LNTCEYSIRWTNSKAGAKCKEVSIAFWRSFVGSYLISFFNWMIFWVLVSMFLLWYLNCHTIVCTGIILYSLVFFFKRGQYGLFMWVYSQIVSWRIFVFDRYIQPKTEVILAIKSWFYYSATGPYFLYKAFKGYFRIFFFIFYFPYLCVLLSPTGDDRWFEPAFVQKVASGLVSEYTVPWFFIGTVLFVAVCSWNSAHYLSSHVYFSFISRDLKRWLSARCFLLPALCVITLTRCFSIVLFFTSRWKLAYQDTEYVYRFFFSIHLSSTCALWLLVFFIFYLALTYKLYYVYKVRSLLGYRGFGASIVDITLSWRVPIYVPVYHFNTSHAFSKITSWVTD